jgi:hypothetical protein
MDMCKSFLNTSLTLIDYRLSRTRRALLLVGFALCSLCFTLVSTSSHADDEAASLRDTITKRLKIESVRMEYTTHAVFFTLSTEESGSFSFASRGEDFRIKYQGKAVLYTGVQKTQEELARELLGEKVIKKPQYGTATLIRSVSYLKGEFRQLLETGSPGLSGIRSRVGYENSSCCIFEPASWPDTFAFYGAGGYAVMDEDIRTRGLGLVSFINSDGQTRIWASDEYIVLTHQTTVPKEISPVGKVCMDFYIDRDGLVRRIDQVVRNWELTEAEWAAVPGLGIWQDGRSILQSVNFLDVALDKTTGVQVPTHIKALRNRLDGPAEGQGAERWKREGRTEKEILALQRTLPVIPYAEYDIQITPESVQINPKLEDSEFTLEFPVGTAVKESWNQNGFTRVTEKPKPWYVHNASALMMVGAGVLIAVLSMFLARRRGWK